MSRQGEYFLRLGTARVPARLERIERVIDASSLESRTSADTVQRHEVAECVLRLGRPLACDAARDVAETGRFVLVCEHEIRGGGIVRETLPDRESWVRDHVLLRNSKWEPSSISPEQRAERYNQTPTLVLITGEEHADRKSLARELEARLFAAGQIAYFLGIRNVLYGVDADLDRTADDRSEHMRRLAEVAHVMLDAGVILVVTAAALTPGDLEIVRTAVEPDRIVTVWLGDDVAAGLAPDLRLRDGRSPAEAAEEVRALLRDRGVLFRGV